MISELSQRQAVAVEAQTWLRTPYMHKARIKGVGIDCGQLLIAVYAACGLAPDFDPGEYPPDWMLHRDEERYLGWVEKFAKPTHAPAKGDIALWRFGRCISHGAIIVEWPHVIHAYRRERMCVLGRVDSGEFESRPPLFYTLWSPQ